MDWVEDMQTNLWAFPRGMKRNGGLSSGSLEWTSKYGSIVASVYEGGSADGMNEKGLVANMLYLAESSIRQMTTNAQAFASVLGHSTSWITFLLSKMQ